MRNTFKAVQHAKLQSQQATFRQDVYQFDIAQNRWNLIGLMPDNGAVTTRPIWFNQQIIIASGEIRPSVRTDKVVSEKVIRH